MVGFLRLCQHFATAKRKLDTVKQEAEEENEYVDSAVIAGEEGENQQVKKKRLKVEDEEEEEIKRRVGGAEGNHLNDGEFQILSETPVGRKDEFVVVKKEEEEEAVSVSGHQHHRCCRRGRGRRRRRSRTKVPRSPEEKWARKAARAELERALGLRPSMLAGVFNFPEDREKTKEDKEAEEDLNVDFVRAVEEAEKLLEVEVDLNKSKVVDFIAEDVVEQPEGNSEEVEVEEEEEIIVDVVSLEEDETVEKETNNATGSAEVEELPNIFLQSYFHPPERLVFPFKEEEKEDDQSVAPSPPPSVIDDDDLQVSEEEGEEEEKEYCDASTETSEDLFDHLAALEKEEEAGADATTTATTATATVTATATATATEEEEEKLLSGRMARLDLSEDEEEEVLSTVEEEDFQRDSHLDTNCPAAQAVTHNGGGGRREGRFCGESRQDRERRKRKRKREKERANKRRGKEGRRRRGSDGESELEEDEEDAASSCSASSSSSSFLLESNRLPLRPRLLPRSARAASTSSSSASSSNEEEFTSSKSRGTSSFVCQRQLRVDAVATDAAEARVLLLSHPVR